MTIEAIPAIDIRGGRCVRLVQGDFGRETTYGDDPVAMARHWQDEGATRLHVVDLDGARDGVRANAALIERLIANLGIPVQVGGGVRTLDDARDLLAAGADRVVMGTTAVEHANQIRPWLLALGAERVIVAVDARGERIASRGWQNVSDLELVPFCQALADLGVQRVLYTDVARDGVLDGPNIDLTRRVAQVLNTIASGGVSRVEHLKALAEAGAEAAVIGTALYTGALRLEEALAC
jgi:phosphoribosylformimino-5-aminoimidazole carboxamide ribotide isomerase